MVYFKRLKNEKITLNHIAKNRQEFNNLIDTHSFKQLLNQVIVHTNDFIYLPAGTIHSLGKGRIAFEVQQSSDVTYLLYDFDRINKKTGKKRPLHLKEVQSITDVPARPIKIKHIIPKDNQVLTLTNNQYFTMNLISVNGQLNLHNLNYQLITVIKGKGIITINNNYPLKVGDSFVLTTNSCYFSFDGKLSLISSHWILKVKLNIENKAIWIDLFSLFNL